jgi:hypothetical protein
LLAKRTRNLLPACLAPLRAQPIVVT